MKKLVVLTGAGISAESGIKTFRDAGGLWEGHDVMEVASPRGFAKNPTLVYDFYNQRRRQLKTVEPNQAHHLLKTLENDFDVHIITQNVDNLHERAGSKNILHLHGELLKARSVANENDIVDWHDDLNENHKDAYGNALRPHIVWFGEEVPELVNAVKITQQADVFLIIGTSLQVYPAAGLVNYVPQYSDIFYIDPNPDDDIKYQKRINIIPHSASEGLKIFIERMA